MQMRAGTQTLIQALQALPWSRVENDDDIPDPSQGDSSDDEEDQPAQRTQVLSRTLRSLLTLFMYRTARIFNTRDTPSLSAFS